MKYKKKATSLHHHQQQQHQKQKLIDKLNRRWLILNHKISWKRYTRWKTSILEQPQQKSLFFFHSIVQDVYLKKKKNKLNWLQHLFIKNQIK
jgi:hypothetical protein